MTHENKELLQRALGKIDGVAFIADDKLASPLLDALEDIDRILCEEKGGE